MSDLVKALLHFKGSVPGKDLENGWCKMVIAPRNTLELGNNNNIYTIDAFFGLLL